MRVFVNFIFFCQRSSINFFYLGWLRAWLTYCYLFNAFFPIFAAGLRWVLSTATSLSRCDRCNASGDTLQHLATLPCLYFRTAYPLPCAAVLRMVPPSPESHRGVDIDVLRCLLLRYPCSCSARPGHH